MTHTHRDIIHVRHPHYLRDSLDWEEWRDTFNGGKYYRDNYLIKFSDRETDLDFGYRRELTPISTFAKSTILDVRNNIYQRLVSVSRVGGSSDYKNAVRGDAGGVDGRGSTMESFIGDDILTELLLMGRVGCYVDVMPPTGPTMADRTFPPYLTPYRVEDILSYTYAPRGKGGEFSAVLLRDWNLSVDGFRGFGHTPHDIVLPNGTEVQFRLVWKDDFDQVWFLLFDKEGDIKFHPDADETGAVLTNLKRVPFVLFDIGQSLMKDIASFQHALLNLGSQDVYYAQKSNSPWLAIQRDGYATGDHLKTPETADGGKGKAEVAGPGKGRYYGINENAPQYVTPPTDTLEASMQLQARLEESIRTLVNLAIQSKAGSRTESAESKKVGQSGLEAGLSFIGLELEEGEKLISQLWAEYENVDNPDYAVVAYPDRYTLKSDMERLEEAEKQIDLIERLPTQELKKTVSAGIVESLLGGKLPQNQLEKIIRKINTNDYILSDPETILAAHEAGLVDDVTASDALGFDADKVVEQAREDRAKRIALTLEAQTPRDTGGTNAESVAEENASGATNPASRGAPELDTNPQSGSDEKTQAQDETA